MKDKKWVITRTVYGYDICIVIAKTKTEALRIVEDGKCEMGYQPESHGQWTARKSKI